MRPARFSLRSLPVLGSGLLLLAACASPSAPVRDTMPAPATGYDTAADGPGPVRRPDHRRPPELGVLDDPVPPPLTAGDLMNRDAGMLARTLGPAELRRRDGPAEVWQYRSATCVLDAYLYPPRKDARLRVVRLEARRRPAADGGKTTIDACLAQLPRYE